MSDNKDKENIKKLTGKQKTVRAILIIMASMAALAVIGLVSVYAVFRHYYDKTNYVDDKNMEVSIGSDDIQSADDERKNDEYLIASAIYDEMSRTAVATEESSLEESEKCSTENHNKKNNSGMNTATDTEKENETETVETEDVSTASTKEIQKTSEDETSAYTSSSVCDHNETYSEKVTEEITTEETAGSSAENTTETEKETEKESEKESETEREDNTEKTIDALESMSIAASETAESIIASLESDMESQSQAMEDQEISEDSKVYNLLLIGVDYNGYSDTIMLVSINENKKKIYITSILRDTSVSVPGLGIMKLNNSYRYGGASLLVSTIEENFKIKIDNYAFIAFEGMWTVFDAIGGLDFYIDQSEVFNANGYVCEMANVYGFSYEPYLFYEGGVQHMSGVQVLAYCRVRYVGNGDADRTNRQRTAVGALIGKLKEMNAGEINSFLNTVLPLVTHNIPSGKVMDILINSSTYLGYEVESLRVPFDGSYSVDQILNYLITADLLANANYLTKTIY